MDKQKGFYWKKVRISLFCLTSLYTQKQKDLEIIALEYNPESETCQMCSHKPIKNIFILQNKQTGDSLRIGSECAVNYVDEKLLLQASGLLRKKVFEEKFKETIDKINQCPYKTKTMKTYLYNISQGNYPWASLVVRLNNELKSMTPKEFSSIEDFIKNHPTRWISKEIQKELDKKNYPTKWQLKEIKKILDKENSTVESPEEISVPPKKFPTREEFKKMTLQEKIALL